MSDNTYIQDDFGNRVPLLDDYGNLSVEVIMLYTEDKLTSADRKTVDDYAATDEMTKDALDGFAITGNPSKTRYHLGQLNSEVQKISGAKAISTLAPARNEFDYRKLAAAITLLVVVLGGTYFASQYFDKTELADSTTTVSEELEKSPEPIIDVQPALNTDSIIPEASTADVPPMPEVENLVVADEMNNSQDKTDAKEDANKLSEVAVLEVDVMDAEYEEAEQAIEIPITVEGNTIVEPNEAIAQAETETAKEFAENYEAEHKRQQVEELALISEASKKDTERERLADSRSSEQAEQGIVAQDAGDYADLIVVEAEQQQSNLKAKKAAEYDRSEELSETNARFPGGDIELYKFLENARDKSETLEGTVTVSFRIEKDGRVSNVKVKTGANNAADQDALRVVNSMPNWEPATLGDKSKRSTRTVVIKYGAE